MGYIYNIVWDFAKIRTFWIISMQITAFFLQATQFFCLFLRFVPPAVYNVHTYVTDLERYRYKEGRTLQQKNFSAAEHVKEKRIYSR